MTFTHSTRHSKSATFAECPNESAVGRSELKFHRIASQTCAMFVHRGGEVAGCDPGGRSEIVNLLDPKRIFSESEMIRVGFGVGLDSTCV